MPDIEFSLDDALALLEERKARAIGDLERVHASLADDLKAVDRLRSFSDDLSHQLRASAIAAMSYVVHHENEGKQFWLMNSHGYAQETCTLVRPLKPGKYRAVVIFTREDEETSQPRR